jgi:hypothetical protein
LDIVHAWQVRLKAAGFFLLIMAYSPLQDCNKLQGPAEARLLPR